MDISLARLSVFVFIDDISIVTKRTKKQAENDQSQSAPYLRLKIVKSPLGFVELQLVAKYEKI